MQYTLLHMQFICIFPARAWLCRTVSKHILALVTTLHLIGLITLSSMLLLKVVLTHV